MFFFVCVAQPLNHRFGMYIPILYSILLCPIVDRYVDGHDVICILLALFSSDDDAFFDLRGSKK